MLALLTVALVAATGSAGDRATPPTVVCNATPAPAPDSNGWFSSSITFDAVEAPALLPWPRQIDLATGYSEMLATTAIRCDAALAAVGGILAAEIAAVTGGPAPPVVVGSSGTRRPGDIALAVDSGLATAAAAAGMTSLVVVNGTGAFVTGADVDSLRTATVTLIQLLTFSTDADSVPPTKAGCTDGPPRWRLPYVTIRDAPEFGVRGLMVDAARAFLPLAALKQYVVMCRLYKLNHLHLHLTDDQSFTFPSTAFPELAAKAPFKYALSELRELQAFAAARGVTIIGEMDVPGHATSLVNALPSVFGFKSLLGKDQVGICDFTSDVVVSALLTIFDEIAAVFPSPYVHCGGDEVPLPRIKDLPEVQDAIKKLGLNSTTDLYRRFIGRMDAYAAAKNRTLIVWEGFAPAKGQTGRASHPPSKVPVPKTVVVSPFDCFYYPPPQLAADGYRIINSAWTPLYIAGGKGSDPELIYKWNPYLFGEVHDHLSWWTVPPEHHSQVVGVKMAVWQTSAAETLCSLVPRLPAMADRSWNPAAARTYVDYVERVTAVTALLGKLLRANSSTSPGSSSSSSSSRSTTTSTSTTTTATATAGWSSTAALPRPAPPGFTGSVGKCRDGRGQFGSRLEHNGAVGLADCEGFCLSLGFRCDAFDWGHDGDGKGVWCGAWGTTLTAADNKIYSGVGGNESLAFTYAGGTGQSGVPVCKAVEGSNFCYHRSEIKCSSSGQGPCLAGFCQC